MGLKGKWGKVGGKIYRSCIEASVDRSRVRLIQPGC